MTHNLGELPYQIDFLTADKPDSELVDFVMSNSTRVQHLLDENPRISRWWFADFSKAMEAMVKCSEHEGLTYRLICLATDSLYIQHGTFDNLVKEN